MLNNYDVIVISETHFNERTRCPEGFAYEGRSQKVPSKIPRGGVAIYRNVRSHIQVEVLCDSLRDCVVFEIKHSNLVIAAQYIPPSNSIYFDDIYMDNLNLIHDKYGSKKLIIIGDLNARIGDISCRNPKISHQKNPDTAVNANGIKLVSWLRTNDDMVVVNGANYIGKEKSFDTNFTFYRGMKKSQNDLTITNDLDMIEDLKINQKLIFSDHCPVSLTCKVKLETPMEFVYDCARNSLSHEHYDINYRLKKAIKFEKLDFPKLISKLSEIDANISEDDSNNVTTVKISDALYKCCLDSYTKNKPRNEPLTGNLVNCTSANFKAIAEANLFAHQSLSKDGRDTTGYVNNWIRFEDLARTAANSELNVRKNKAWRDKKYDGKKLWEAIDWKGKAEEKMEKPAYEADTLKYFTGIFNSEKTAKNPIISDIEGKINNYNNYIPKLDDPISMKELQHALDCIGTGVSIDGIPPDIAKVLPNQTKALILNLMNNIFAGAYPDEWCKQILHSIKKDGHSSKNPKLRGIAIAPFLCRIYDIIIDVRFTSWFRPNKEQASQPAQGCPLQIFMLFLLISYSKENNKDLFVGFLDYEKAYDYVNRAEVVTSLMNDGCGGNLTKAIAKMFQTSEYFPKSNRNRLSESIRTDHGVTQGRRSSGSIFSYYVSGMPGAVGDIEYDDFMDPLTLAQLADDTALYAEKIENLIKKFVKIFIYSKNRYQVPNISKTLYCHFAADPLQTPLMIDEHTFIHCVDMWRGYRYLGIFFFPTNDIILIIQKNFDKRMVHISKFYAWLSVNEDTPVDIKLLVLDSCVFQALLYGIECMGDIGCIEKKLRDIETKALKAILGVKKGTCNDLIFHELRRSSIIARIKDRQYNFYKKLSELSADDAIVKLVIEQCKDSQMIKYYENLSGDYADSEMTERENRIITSDHSMPTYYREIGMMNVCGIYSSMLSDYYRTVLTRWRLSNHSLKIETGRYTVPYTERKDRLCTLCGSLEDEQHVIFDCPRYDDLRRDNDLFREHTSVGDLLNPTYDNMRNVASLLHGIENRYKELNL